MNMKGLNLNAVAPAVAKVEMERGEEPLYETLSVAQGVGKKTIIAGLDAGSTQTRVKIIDKESQNINKTYIIPSMVQRVPDMRELKPKSDIIYDRMDTAITNLTMNPDPVFNNVRLIRGRKTVDNNFPELRIQSSVKKTDEEVFYLNIIDALGYAIAFNYSDEVPTEVDVYAGVALPPDDMISSKLINKFRAKILGQYKWMHNDSGISILINIKDVVASTEPEAFAQAYYVLSGVPMPERVIMVNTGGRSTGLELLENGKAVTEISKTLKYGGRQFLLDLNNKIIQSENNTIENIMSEDVLSKAVKKGYVKRGKCGRVEVIPEIESLCKDYATDYMSDIKTNILDRRQLDLNDVDEVIMSGGLVRRGEYDISISDFLGDEINKLAPDTEFVVVEENYIPTGTILLAFQTFNTELQNADDDEDFLSDDDLVDDNKIED